MDLAMFVKDEKTKITDFLMIYVFLEIEIERMAIGILYVVSISYKSVRENPLF